MKTTNQLTFIFLLLLMVSCNENTKKITNTKDYVGYLEASDKEVLQLVKEDFNFWEKKLEKEPNQFPYLAKAAASQSVIFNKTGNIDALIKAETFLVKANQATNYNNAGYLRALSRNYISQHRFKEALLLLIKAEDNGEGLKGTQKMLFDVHLELGNYDAAKTYLDGIKKKNDFDYLIRLSKWSDHRGNLDAAIKYMEQAKTIAESTNLASTKQWVYTNLADYYGHAGRIEASYNHYLKALELDPNDAYAKKGIAWIVYSYEKNPDEALRILNEVTKTYNAPDYHLLKAEIAEYNGNNDLKEEQLKLYANAVENSFYGDMYNKYNALLYAESEKDTAKALEIAYVEIKNRPTPQSYDLLAWTLYNHGEVKEAMEILEQHVIGKTSEPDVLFHIAKIYKANREIEKANALKKELLESVFELGPIMENEIKNI
ncbi:cell surface protein [Algibacter amylolyticus]|uniref:Cell surface protein n=1 Tax=Algibacter amylolyticus TaxID=1608400 RepID=A0A5M7B189_9FLAO|nr:cell surface protein [Algibacter amylolyticus]KAA5823446.1 cell surface protein [Algibacter amylolyticus]MBB5267595.1 Tfp pilus assembly protein PilF [Algibacter amylolyticus]TSJ73934.1 cell surface protein [Algibacter amylolyticus]